eukprot:TRINITY_DN238_c0_g1_i1.p1 TRINITY_DN238_c0_g1~~TRINITY_DN238_c0_g1_i1.p1  ORF type:complete len:164 (-),score=44.37 TRINITY_DN238_c0_g1_i1:202-693(-)
MPNLSTEDATDMRPKMIRSYNLRTTAPHIRAILREEFDKHMHIRERKVIDLLVYKGENELMETKEMWKTYSHVAEFFERPLAVKEQPIGPNVILSAETLDRKKKQRELVEDVIKTHAPDYDVSTITDEQVADWIYNAAWMMKMMDETTGPQEIITVDPSEYKL